MTIVVLGAGCASEYPSSIREAALRAGAGWPTWESNTVVAHRGFACCVPENTFEALEAAIALGATSIELDARLTSDRVPVLMHDPWLDRTTDGSGRVDSHTLAQLRLVNACPGRSTPCRIATLREVLEFARGRVRIVIDLKGIENPHSVIPFVRDIQAAQMTHDVAVISGDLRALAWTRALVEEIPLGLYIRPEVEGRAMPRSTGVVVDRLLSFGRTELLLTTGEIDRRGPLYQVALAHGLPIVGWTTYHREHIRALLSTPGVTRVLSDVPF